MKKVFAFLLIALMLVGCQSSEGVLSDELREEIVAHYQYTGTDTENTIAGMQYYGIYHGYVILMDAGQLAMTAKVDIGGRIFKWGSANLILIGYKDGVEYELKNLYEAGEISESDLDTILEEHKEHFAQTHFWDYDKG